MRPWAIHSLLILCVYHRRFSNLKTNILKHINHNQLKFNKCRNLLKYHLLVNFLLRRTPQMLKKSLGLGKQKSEGDAIGLRGYNQRSNLNSKYPLSYAARYKFGLLKARGPARASGPQMTDNRLLISYQPYSWLVFASSSDGILMTLKGFRFIFKIFEILPQSILFQTVSSLSMYLNRVG